MTPPPEPRGLAFEAQATQHALSFFTTSQAAEISFVSGNTPFWFIHVFKWNQVDFVLCLSLDNNKLLIASLIVLRCVIEVIASLIDLFMQIASLIYIRRNNFGF
jgi:hypothetical protein